jgi:hypothetical protein
MEKVCLCLFMDGFFLIPSFHRQQNLPCATQRRISSSMSSSSNERVRLLTVELKPTGPPGDGAGPVLFALGGIPIGLIAARSVRVTFFDSVTLIDGGTTNNIGRLVSDTFYKFIIMSLLFLFAILILSIYIIIKKIF